MDFEGLKVQTAEKEKRDEKEYRSEFFGRYASMIHQFGELATLLQSSEINLGKIESTVHQPAGMAIARIEVGSRDGLLGIGEVNPSSNFTIHYSLRSTESMSRFPVAQEMFGVDARDWQNREFWDSWDIVRAEQRVGTMLEEAPKTLAMLIDAAKDSDLNPELASLVSLHYEEGDLPEAV